MKSSLLLFYFLSRKMDVFEYNSSYVFGVPDDFNNYNYVGTA